jgi:hypothetical protein
MTPENNKRKIFVGFFLLLLIISVPLTVLITRKTQETRSHASGSTSLLFTPASTASTPLQKNVGDIISVDLMVNPGTNLVTFVRFQISYDPTKLQPTDNPFTLNTTAFPIAVEGPVVGNGTIAESVSIGSDPTKAITTVTKIGTLNFKALAPTNGTATIASFTSLSQALSAGQTEQAGENVLSTTTPAYIVIGGNANTTPAITPIATSIPGEGTMLNVRLLLHGVGAAGDNPNPSASTLSNKNPLHPQRNLDVQIFDSNNQLVSSVSAPTAINYEGPTVGGFAGSVDLGPSFPSGKYNIKVKTDRYLRKLVPGIFTIENKQVTNVADVAMIAGDTNGDNFLNVLDYNALLDCGFGNISPLPMADPNATYNSTNCKGHPTAELVDVNDDGVINGPDYNLFIRELSVQNGD